MYEVTLPRSDDSQSAQSAPKGRTLWLLLILGVILVGGVVRTIPAAQNGGLAAWLPWMNQPKVTLYFSDTDGYYFVPVTRSVSSATDLPRTAVDELIRGPQADSGLLPTLPPDTVINTLAVNGSTVYVDLSGAGLTRLNAIQSIQAGTAIERSLTALPQVETVVISIDGRSLFTAAEPTAPPLYFAMGAYLVPVNAPDQTTDPGSVIEAYLQGPPNPAVLIGLPPETSLLALEFNRENGLVKVNLRYTEAVRALALADPERMVLVLTGLIATVTELPGVKAVMLDFEGHSQLGLGQCASLLRTPQLRPQGLNIETATR